MFIVFCLKFLIAFSHPLNHDRRYIPVPQANRRTANPHAIPKLSHTTFSLLPPTSLHPTGTSTTGIPALSANINISTSKIHPSECIYGMIYGSASRENNLNPHCVSRMRPVAGGVKSLSSKWKECMRRFLRKERLTTASLPTKWALDPTATAPLSSRSAIS